MTSARSETADLIKVVLCCAMATLALQGCGKSRHAVIAATGTNIGVEISQNPATQSPQAKLGYQRTELAIVPSNRAADGNDQTTHQGALDVADVLMELKYAGIFDIGTASGIYQRLAVGPIAVQQRGAAYMFARDAKGELDGKVADDITNALAAVPRTPPVDVLRAIRPLSRAYLDLAPVPGKKSLFDQAAQGQGFPDFQDFLRATNVTPEQVQNIRSALERDPEIMQKLMQPESTR